MARSGNGGAQGEERDFGADPEKSAQLVAKIRDSSLHEEERLIAIKLGGDLMNMDDGIADALLAVVTSDEESEELRSNAAIALGPVLEDCDLMGFDFDDDDVAISEETYARVRRELKRIVLDEHQPRDVRRSAMEASVRAPDDWHEPEIRAALESADPLWKITAVFSMGFVGGFDRQILAALDDDDSRIEREAILAAGHQSVGEAFPKIRALAESEEAERGLRLAAVEALSGYDSTPAIETLHTLAEHDDEEVAELAEYGLSFMVDPRNPGAALFDIGGDEDDDLLEDGALDEEDDDR
jgi:HEAT repeat protein